MSTPAGDVREALRRVEHGLAGLPEAILLKTFIETVVFEFGYSDTESWYQCRFCHRKKGVGHDDFCPAAELG